MSGIDGMGRREARQLDWLDDESGPQAGGSRVTRRLGRGGTRARARRRPPLVAAALLGQTAWLDGQLRWAAGRLVWRHAAGEIAPGGGDLALAERRLRQLARVLGAAPRPDPERLATLARRRERLALAVRLSDLGPITTPPFVEVAAAPDEAIVARAVALLLAEAYCLDDLPVAPSRVLWRCGPRALDPLAALVAAPDAPPQARALGALLLGALARRYGRGLPPPNAPWPRRACAWGRAHGFPPSPALVATLLGEEDGAALVGRYLGASASGGPFALPPNWLRGLLARGCDAAQVVALAEAAARLGSLAAPVLDYRAQLLEHPSRHRRAQAKQLRRECEAALARLVELAHRYAWQTADPGALDGIGAFPPTLLGCRAPHREVLATIVATLEDGLVLPETLQAGFLALLAEGGARCWDRASKLHAGGTPDQLTTWLANGRSGPVAQLIDVLRATGDVAFAREALRRGALGHLAFEGLGDRDSHRWALDALEQLRDEEGALPKFWQVRALLAALGWFPTRREARRVLNACLAMLRAVPPALRARLLAALLDNIEEERGGRDRALRVLLPHIPALARCATRIADLRLVGAILPGLLVVARRDATAVPAWLGWVCQDLAERRAAAVPDGGEVADDRRPAPWTLELALLIALALAPDDAPRCREIFAVASRAEFERGEEPSRAGLALLAALPELRAALAAAFPRQRGRCLTILARLDEVARLGPGAVAALGAAYRRDVLLDLPEGWAAVIALDADAGDLARRYLHACQIANVDPSVPAGISRALALPERLAGELAHLERAVPRSDLLIRAANLRARLADRAALAATVRDEVLDRLAAATGEAELRAAERAVEAPLRVRLAEVARLPIVPGALDGPLLNAAQLSIGLGQNRRLLRALLRAHLAGEADWRARHPRNRAFLAELAARGGDPDAWLAPSPRDYPCPGASGGTLRLAAETEPVRILQMGAFFGTCLSPGGGNGYSAVTNACEANKLVVYAADGAGRTVGRQLLAITEGWGIVGFHIYSSLPDGAGHDALRAIFRRYAAERASACRLPLADAGTVPTLFAQGWYDDGVVSWQDDKPTPPGAVTSRRERP